MTAGRPLKYKTLNELKVLIDAYFDKCILTEEPLTITGLGLSVGLSRKQLIEYTTKDKFRNTIKRAKQKVEHDYELSLRKNGRAGDIFGLKNFGWKDRQEIEHSTDKETLNHMARLTAARQRRAKIDDVPQND